ncbi:MAG: hypothetical protein ACK5YI_22850 [Rhodospirillales bacterium]|jgi:hypothetical protein
MAETASRPRMGATVKMGIVAAVVALILAACGSTPPPETAGFGCPRIGILREAAQATTFRPGAGRDATDVAYRARIVDYGGRCSIDTGVVEVELDLRMAAQRGPAGAADRVGYRYFVAVTDAAQNILAREVFDVDFVFEGRPQVGSLEQLTQRIPLARGVDGRNYEVLVGFALTPEQVEWNRTQREAR